MINTAHTHLKAVFKALPLIILGLYLLKIRVSFVAPFSIKSQEYEMGVAKNFTAMIFSIMGDIYLIYSGLFVYGIISFVIAQGFLVFAFSDDGHLFFQVRAAEMMSLICIAVISFLLYIYLYPKFKGSLTIPVSVYFVIITLMVWCSVMQTQKHVCISSVAGAVGAGLFYISDVLLAINKWRGPIPKVDVLVMPTYYIAQFMITFSFVHRD